MKVKEFARKISRNSDNIPVEVKSWAGNTLAADKSLWHYATNGGPELDSTIRSIVIGKDLITIFVK